MFGKKGFVTTSIDEVVSWARGGSMWPMTFVWLVVLLK